MDFAPKSTAAGAASNVDINSDMDEVLKRIQVFQLLSLEITFLILFIGNH